MDSEEIGRLLAKQAISEVIYAYCRAVDRMDRDLARSIWAEDADVDYGDTYRGSAVGLLDVIWRIHGTMRAHSHQVTNIIIQLDGDHAVSESYYSAYLRPLVAAGEAPTQLSAYGRYLDRWVRRDGRWAISHRKVASDFGDISVVNDAPFPATGANNSNDPSYAFLS